MSESKSRRWRTMLPPPPPLPSTHVLEGSDDPVAELLWRALREIRRWTSATAKERSEPRGDPADAEQVRLVVERLPDLEEPLACFLAIRRSPGLVTAGMVAGACERLHAWADERGLTLTALCFAEAWVAVDPDNPIANNAAGRMARHVGDVPRAEVWFDRGYRLAARHRNRREFIRALLGHGVLLRELGRFAEARELMERAAKMAASTRRHRQAAEAAHDLLCIAIEENDAAGARKYVETALAEYPIHHPSIPRFVHDWSFFLVRQRLYAEALPLLTAIAPQAARPELRMLYMGTLARAAAGAGRRDLWDDAARAVVELADTHQEFSAAALANVAEGARFFAAWDEGATWAARAIHLARLRGENDVLQGAEAIAAAIARHDPPAVQSRPVDAAWVESLTRRIASLLRHREKPARRPVQTDRDRAPRRDSPLTKSSQELGVQQHRT